MDNILSIKGISKSFGGRKVLDDLTFEVPRNSVYGFVGKNGAGKTTTMKLILGLYQPDKGEIYVNGKKVSFGQNETNKYIGYLPDVPEFYGYMKPTEYLKLCAEITDIPKNEVDSRIKTNEEQIKDIKAYLQDLGYVTEYSALSEDEKNNIMIELMKLKEQGKISLDDYYEESAELWKK